MTQLLKRSQKKKKIKKNSKAEEQKKDHEEENKPQENVEQAFLPPTNEVQETSKPVKTVVSVESGVGTTISRDFGIQTESKDDKEVQVVLLLPGTKKPTRDVATQCDEVKVEHAIQTEMKEDKSAQTKSWDQWEREFILNYEKKQQLQQQQQSFQSIRWDSVSRETSSRDVPLTYLEKRTRGSGSLPKLDVRNAKMAVLHRPNSKDEEEISSRSFRGVNIEEMKGKRQQKFTHVGNILLKNNFATYNIYNLQ